MSDQVEDFMAFYDATCDDAYRLACCYLGDAQTAGEVVVRTYVRAFRSLDEQQRSGYSPRAWLLCALTRELDALSPAHRPQRVAS